MAASFCHHQKPTSCQNLEYESPASSNETNERTLYSLFSAQTQTWYNPEPQRGTSTPNSAVDIPATRL